METAHACLARNDNPCVVQALAGRARTEQELGLLATTYRLMGNRPAAQATMRQYVERFPTGPRADGFRSFLGAP
jgi:hypothetical protein